MELTNLESHSTNPSSYRCSICDKTFSNKFNLKRHMNRCSTLPITELHNLESHSTNPSSSSSHFRCNHCNNSFSNKFNLMRHMNKCSSICKLCRKCFPNGLQEHLNQCRLTCDLCKKQYKNLLNFNRHRNNCLPHSCHICQKLFQNKTQLHNHLSTHNVINDNVYLKKLYRSYQTPNEDGIIWLFLDENVIHVYFKNVNRSIGPIEFFDDRHDSIKQFYTNVLKDWSQIKSNFVLECTFKNIAGDTHDANFKAKTFILNTHSDVDKVLMEDTYESVLVEFFECELCGSGYTLDHIDGLLLKVYNYKPLKGGSGSFIDVPLKIAKTKSIINPFNQTDYFCFKYAILSRYLDDSVKSFTPSAYGNINHDLDFSVIKFPTPLNDIIKFERRNDVSVNIYTLDKTFNVYPIRVSDVEKPAHFDLLLLSNGVTFHYAYIKSFPRLLRSQTKCNGRLVKDYCKRCFMPFDFRYCYEYQVIEHKRRCAEHAPVRAVMPSEEKKWLYFKNFERMVSVPVVAYCDFETVAVPLPEELRPGKSYSNLSHHKVVSFGVMIISTLPNYPSMRKPLIYTGTDAIKRFVSFIVTEAKTIDDILRNVNLPIRKLNDQELKRFRESTMCDACGLPFTDTDPKVKDHCHFTGKFRAVLHSSCNIKIVTPTFFPIYFHNLSGFDGHFIVQELGYDNKTVNIIASSRERFTCVEKKITPTMNLRFLDSYKFLSENLNSLALSLDSFPWVDKCFPNSNESILLKQKGIFPYDYLTSIDKLTLNRLPEKEHFYNSLKDEDVTDKEYEFAQSVWSTFKMSSMKDYLELYLTADVLLLTDVFENFRQLTLKSYCLDPCWYVSLPSLSFDCMLKLTRVRLELLTDLEMQLLLDTSLRGGCVNVIAREATANNPDTTNFNPLLPSSYILYIDCNSLYGTSMCYNLPIDGYKWVEDVDRFDLNDYSEDSSKGAFIECSVEYPPELHDDHNELPLLPVNQIPPGGKKVKKLLSTLDDKEKYVLHHLTLQHALKRGLKLKQIHRVITFNQRAWLKPYVDINIQFRQNSKSEFEKTFFKLIINCIYGKCIENCRKWKNIEICVSKKRMSKLIKKPNFIDADNIADNVFIVNLKRESLYFNRPVPVGFTILEISKYYMNKFFYETLRNFYTRLEMKLLYTDTDSLILHLFTNNLTSDLLKLESCFDFSNYPNDHVCYSNNNKKKLGYFKDEAGGEMIYRYIGLRPKMYSLLFNSGKEYKKIKGLQSSMKKEISFADYETCHVTKDATYESFRSIISTKHQIYTRLITKRTLDSNDDKRYLLSDNINTLAYGHYMINEIEEGMDVSFNV